MALANRTAQIAVTLTDIGDETGAALLERVKAFCAQRGETMRGVVSLALARHLAHPPDAPAPKPAPQVTALPPCEVAAPPPQKRGPKKK